MIGISSGRRRAGQQLNAPAIKTTEASPIERDENIEIFY